jgi:Lysyl oxidase
MRRLVVLVASTTGLALIAAFPLYAGGGGKAATGPLPDLQTVVPRHLQLVNQQQKELLRFANGIANTGQGPLALRPDPPIADATATTTAIQEIRSSNDLYKCGEQPKQITACYTIVRERVTGTFEFHPAHNHWHIGDVALFEIRKGSATGPIVGGQSIKTTFCLIDWYQLEGNSNTADRVFHDCERSYQGIQSGWVDQYHHALPGQELELTGVANADDYYLVSTSNFARRFEETDYMNNTAWVKFRLYTDSSGNRKIEVKENSPCSTAGLCGENAPNR